MLKDRLKADFKTAMKEKNAILKLVVADIRGAIQYAETRKGRTDEAQDDEILKIISKCVKDCKESLEAFTKAGYEAEITEHEAKLVLFESYLPKNASEKQLQTVVDGVIARNGYCSIQDMGAVMKEAKAKISEMGLGFDGKELSSKVKITLSNP